MAATMAKSLKDIEQELNGVAHVDDEALAKGVQGYPILHGKKIQPISTR